MSVGCGDFPSLDKGLEPPCLAVREIPNEVNAGTLWSRRIVTVTGVTICLVATAPITILRVCIRSKLNIGTTIVVVASLNQYPRTEQVVIFSPSAAIRIVGKQELAVIVLIFVGQAKVGLEQSTSKSRLVPRIVIGFPHVVCRSINIQLLAPAMEQHLAIVRIVKGPGTGVIHTTRRTV